MEKTHAGLWSKYRYSYSLKPLPRPLHKIKQVECNVGQVWKQHGVGCGLSRYSLKPLHRIKHIVCNVGVM